MKIRSGVNGFDALIDGGIPKGISIILQGPPGSEMQHFYMQFLKEGLENGGSIIAILSKKSPEKLIYELSSIGINVDKLLKENRLIIIDWYSFKMENISCIQDEGHILRCSADLTNVSIALGKALSRIKGENIRAVVDIFSEALNSETLEKVYDFALGCKGKFYGGGITALFLLEKGIHDAREISNLQVPFDGIIDIERQKIGDRIMRKIGILSMKDSDIPSTYEVINIRKDGISVGKKKRQFIKCPRCRASVESKVGTCPYCDLPIKSFMKILLSIDKRIKLHPKDTKLWLYKGLILSKGKFYDKALVCFDTVIEMDKYNKKAWDAKAKALAAMGKYKEAAVCSEESVKISTPQVGEGIEELPIVEDLKIELREILGEEEIPSKDEIKERIEFECPKCGSISEDGTLCQGCGKKLTDMDELPDELLAKAEGGDIKTAHPSSTEVTPIDIEKTPESMESEKAELKEKTLPKTSPSKPEPSGKSSILVDRIQSGIPEFDTIVGGGIPKDYSILLQSSADRENTIFTNRFIKEGLENSEPVLVVLSKISSEELRKNLEAFGIDARKYEEKGLLKIVKWYSDKDEDLGEDVVERDGVIYSSWDLRCIGIAISKGIKALPKATVKRAVLDVISQAFNSFDYDRGYSFIQAMIARTRHNKITSLFPLEIGSYDKKPVDELHKIFDGVIDIKTAIEGDEQYKEIRTISKTGVHFSSQYTPFIINNNEMIIGKKEEEEGVSKEMVTKERADKHVEIECPICGTAVTGENVQCPNCSMKEEEDGEVEGEALIEAEEIQEDLKSGPEEASEEDMAETGKKQKKSKKKTKSRTKKGSKSKKKRKKRGKKKSK